MDPALLPSLAWFALVAEHRSFTKAAAEMGVSRAALSQSLKALERRLNVKLLYRTTRDMSLTEAGQRLYDAPSGLLRVNTSRMAAKVLVEPHLGELMACYPKLRLELVMDDGLANIVADGCDAGIRLGESLAEHVVAVPISPMMEMAVVASPAYFRRHGRPRAPADLVQHNCVCYRQTSSGAIFSWEFSAPGEAGHDFAVAPQGSFTTNDDDGMIRVALQDAGLIQHMEIAVRPYLREGRLERVLQDWCKPFPGFYLYIPSRQQIPSKVRALMDFLVRKRDGMSALP